MLILGKKNLQPNIFDIRLLSFKGFDLEDNSVDFLYGISVMTHLTEYHQGLWLKEIARILKPGSVAILTVNGEVVTCQSTLAINLPFVEQFGFFDGFSDSALGAEKSNYYRATYHDRLYINQVWSDYFEIVDIVPACNAFRQDYVILRKQN